MPSRDYTQLKMKTSGLLFAVSAAASLTFLLARPLTPSDWPVIFKVLSIFLLAVLGLRVDGLLGAALALSSVGDFLLGIRRIGNLEGESLFLLGLVSFLVAHLVYIALFRKYRGPIWWNLTGRGCAVCWQSWLCSGPCWESCTGRSVPCSFRWWFIRSS